ncbi:MAG: efflux RND transporter periplasmic adaptor subunit [Treponema sp.]|jgi:HlyD family secretion protein|nr:efflux RND transporter periplasmic adaptor subunit [Treponema sp.]
MKKLYFRLCLCVAVLVPMLLAGCTAKKSGPKSYDFAVINRGNLERTVTSSGTINPIATVKVLPRMSGKVEKVLVDFNEQVRKGDILAELNTDMLRLQREQQNASVMKARANYELQRMNYRNQEALAEKNLISEYELRTSKTTLDNQAADLAVAEANLKVIETEINQYAFITSPIDGIVLDRNINVGDTVVDSSSNNSSSIFTLAENLKDMQIEAGVGELDVASIHKGQAVRFTLESLPRRTFIGEVETLRLVPSVQNSVVSYTVIINVENQDGALLPGMTCAVDFIVERGENVLLIPNAALRYQPTNMSADEIAEMVFNAGLKGLGDEERQAAIAARAAARTQSGGQNSGQAANANTGLAGLVMGNGGGRQGQMMRVPGGGGGGGGRQGGGQGGGGRQGGGQAGQGRTQTPIVMRNLWYINDEGKLDCMRVQAGISNGSFTEIRSRSEELEGKQVILREKL